MKKYVCPDLDLLPMTAADVLTASSLVILDWEEDGIISRPLS